jgi:cysteine desulfurase family protein (TIGR01976 family)
MALDITLARGQFPALSGEWTFMDNAGGSQVPLQVADAMRDYLLRMNVQHGATYDVSRKAAAAVDAGRRMAAELLGATPGEIIFGQNASQLLRMLALVLSTKWEPEDEVIITEAEHEANAGCWEFLEQFGIVVKTWDIDPDSMTFDISRLTDLLTPRTRLLAIHHSSNILGNVFPVREVARLARGAGALVCVDGVGYVPHRLVDVKDLGVDFYVFSAYKAFGPHLGVMYGRAEVLKELPSWNHFFLKDEAPGKFELGSGGYEAAAALAGLEKYYRALGKSIQDPIRSVLASVYGDIAEHEAKLSRELLSYLKGKKKVTVIGEADPRRTEDRLPIISFLVDDADPEELTQRVDKSRIGIRWGHFYSVRLMNALDLLQYKGVVRVSLAHYNTEAELHRLRDALDPVLS